LKALKASRHENPLCMKISPFFLDLRSAYQAEMDDLTYDSEGGDVLHQRLAARRKELGFLLQMMQPSPEMVAVVFHKGFDFKLPAVMEHLLTHESDEFPQWDSLTDAIHLLPWTLDLTQAVLKEPMGEWFLTVAAGLDYMYHQRDTSLPAHTHDEDEDHELSDEERAAYDSEEEREARARDEAGAQWMVEQGFDHKD
jgi:hypothetical protein